MRIRNWLPLAGPVLLLTVSLLASSASALPINLISTEIAADASAEIRDGLVPPLIAPDISDPPEVVGGTVAIRNALAQVVDPLNFRSGSASSSNFGSHVILPQNIKINFSLRSFGTVSGGLEGLTSGMGRGRIEFSFGPSFEAGPGATISLAFTPTLLDTSDLPAGATLSVLATLENTTTGVTLFDSDVDGLSSGISLGGVSIDDVLVLEYELKLDVLFLAPVDINPTFVIELAGLPIAAPEPGVATLLMLGLVALAARSHREAHARS